MNNGEYTQELSLSMKAEISLFNGNLDSITFDSIVYGQLQLTDKEAKILYEILDAYYGKPND